MANVSVAKSALIRPSENSISMVSLRRGSKPEWCIPIPVKIRLYTVYGTLFQYTVTKTISELWETKQHISDLSSAEATHARLGGVFCLHRTESRWHCWTLPPPAASHPINITVTTAYNSNCVRGNPAPSTNCATFVLKSSFAICNAYASQSFLLKLNTITGAKFLSMTILMIL